VTASAAWGDGDFSNCRRSLTRAQPALEAMFRAPFTELVGSSHRPSIRIFGVGKAPELAVASRDHMCTDRMYRYRHFPDEHAV
jgi:hypothetical protein